jgi:hypothetical protein
MELAEKMLRSYPDYGKSPPEYLAGIGGVLAELSFEVRKELFDPMRGIRSRCKFLPTIADIVEMADQIGTRFARRDFINQHYAHKRLVEETPRTEFIPFPLLWSMFSGEPELLKNRTFDVLYNAFMAMRQGKEAARQVLSLSPPNTHQRS